MSDLPIMDMLASETDCCPKFDPIQWEDKVFEFDNLLFARAYTRSVRFIPINMGSVMTHAMHMIESSEAKPKDRYLILSRDITPWKCEHLFLVTKDVEGMDMVKLSGTFYSKVFEGEYRDLPKWMKTMTNWLKVKGMHAKEIYAFYTTCPKCAKHYGANYVVLFARKEV